MNSLLDAFDSRPVSRLTKTFHLLSNESKAALKSQRDLLSDSNNYENLNNFLSNCSPPLVPFPGKYRTSLKKCHSQGNIFNEKKKEIWIDIEKMVGISAIVQEIHRWQSVGYNFTPVKQIQDHISNYPLLLERLSAEILSYDIQK